VPGERLAVQGKKTKNASGRPPFRAQKLAKTTVRAKNEIIYSLDRVTETIRVQK
jgi:hypothetical protein